MSILVTGGLGFIGSHTVVALINQGYKVVIADNLSNSKIDVLYALENLTKETIPFHQIDVADEDALSRLFENQKISGVIHFAGYKAVGESITDPLKYYRNNLLSTINLANVCQKKGVNKFIFSSSATVYGNNNVPFTEGMQLLPTTNPYGETKAMCERILVDLSQANKDFKVALLRYFNPIGAHPSGVIGESPNGIPNNLIPFVTQVAKGRLKELLVFGNDYPTPDGTGIRDYIHVMDLAEGHVAALKNINTGIHVYNLGTGKGTSVLEIIRTFEKVNSVKIPYKIVNRREGDIAFSYADVSKAQIELNWVAKRNLEQMCRDAWNFEKEFALTF